MKEIKYEGRESSIELYRIIIMLLIVAHHYVGNSGVMDLMAEKPYEIKAVFLYLFGAWGKTGINCFLLITGYYMCTGRITLRKYCKLLFEILFYNIIIYVVFCLTGRENISAMSLMRTVIPVFEISDNFTGCFLIFYLFIPFLNVLIKNINMREHLLLIFLLGVLYVVLGTVPKMSVKMNYVSWFMALYCIASYIRLYPKPVFGNIKIWTMILGALLILSGMSIFVRIYYGKDPYGSLQDSNTFLAVAVAISSFLVLKNIRIKSGLINVVASSNFGVLLIHTNSDAMRQWLWKDFLNVQGVYSLEFGWVLCHAVLSVLIIYCSCTVIDQLRIRMLESKLFNWLDSVNFWKIEKKLIDGKE